MPVEVKGVIELRKALRQFAPDLAKDLTKEMGAALKPITRKSRSFLPSNDEVLSGWVKSGKEGRKFPEYDASIARKGITYKTSPSKRNSRGFKSIASIFNKTAAGAIYETAGRKTPSSIFVQNLQAKAHGQFKGSDKQRGRVLYRAWEEDQGKTQDAVLRAIEKAASILNSRSQVR